MYVVDRTLRFIAGAIFAAFVLAAVGMSAANAQQSQSLQPSAHSLPIPGQLLQQNPNGGPLLANAVQQLALSDPSTFKVLLGLLANANDAQKGAIGRGARSGGEDRSSNEPGDGRGLAAADRGSHRPDALRRQRQTHLAMCS